MALLERFYDPSSGVVQAEWLRNSWEVDFFFGKLPQCSRLENVA